MDYRFPSAAYLPVTCPRKEICREILRNCRFRCFAKNRGFGADPAKKDAPEFLGIAGGKRDAPILDRVFLEKVESVRRSANDQKKAVEDRTFLPIDYDAPIESEQSKAGLASKIGVGIAVVALGLVFTFGDFFPSGSNIPADYTVIEKKLSETEKSTLKEAVRQFDYTLSKSPKDPVALEGEAVTLVELGEYQRASSLLQKLLKETPVNVDAYRLLGEVKYELKDYEESASAYRSCLSISKSFNFEVLRGLTNALLAAKKPDEAVQVLLSSRENFIDVGNIDFKKSSDKLNELDKRIPEIDPIQVDLLLGKAYSDWGHVSDAVAVYDQLISKHPDDFRGYLAKAIILKENGKVGDAERMFIQARFFAPEKAKGFVDRYSRR